MILAPADAIAELFASAGARQYPGEPVTVAAHLLQAGTLAEAAGAPSPLVAAALLHDVGYLCGDETGSLHESQGAAWLARWFPPPVTEPVRLHVAAKRYLCAVEPSYFALLSEASVRSLSVQGGPMSEAETREFTAHPHAAGGVAVRRWDDQAKDPAAATPGFGHFRPVLEELTGR